MIVHNYDPYSYKYSQRISKKLLSNLALEDNQKTSKYQKGKIFKQNHLIKREELTYFQLIFLINQCHHPNYNRSMNWKLYVLNVVFLTVIVNTQVYQKNITFSEMKAVKGWYYLTSFDFTPPTARVWIQTKFTGKPKSKTGNLFVQAVKAEDWEQEQEVRCKKKHYMPVIIHEVKRSQQKTQNGFQFSINEPGTYHFVIKDCNRAFRRDYQNQKLVLRIKLEQLPEDFFQSDTEKGKKFKEIGFSDLSTTTATTTATQNQAIKAVQQVQETQKQVNDPSQL